MKAIMKAKISKKKIKGVVKQLKIMAKVAKIFPIIVPHFIFGGNIEWATIDW